MFKNNITNEEEKVDIPEKILPCENNINYYNNNLNKEEKQIKSNTNIISSTKKPIYNYISNSSNKNLKKEDLDKETKIIASNQLLNNQTINNNNAFKSIKITNKINKTEKKKKKKKKEKKKKKFKRSHC